MKLLPEEERAALGRKAEARLTKLTPEERSEIARKAGMAGGRGRKKQGEKADKA